MREHLRHFNGYTIMQNTIVSRGMMIAVFFVLGFAPVAVQVLMSFRPAAALSEADEPNSRNQIRSSFPVVAYDGDRSTLSSEQRARSRKYDRINILNPGITEDSTVASSNHWEVELSELPIEKSVLVLLGTVKGSQAILSDNRKSVFSEFAIEAEHIFKDSTGETTKSPSVVFAERRGGIVHYPSGFDEWVFIVGQGMPSVGGKYLFFLSHEFPEIGKQQADLTILTAYEIRNNIVVPLDNPGAGTHPIARVYRDRPQSVLMADLQRRITETDKLAHPRDRD